MSSATLPRIKHARVALVGNPNVGKTSLFNALTGLNQRVANYPGVTVEKKTGAMLLGDYKVEIVDLPGIYSLSAHSPDERVALSVLTEGAFDLSIDVILLLLDAANLERNLYLYSQLIELGRPVIGILNMLDVAANQGIKLNIPTLEHRLGIPIISVNASKRQGLTELRQAMKTALIDPQLPTTAPPLLDWVITEQRDRLRDWVDSLGTSMTWSNFQIERALIDEGGHAESEFIARFGPQAALKLKEARLAADPSPSLAAHEARSRYAWIQTICTPEAIERPPVPVITFSDRLDNVLTHPIYGSVTFLLIMAFLFQSIYAWSAPLMDLIDGAFAGLGAWVGSLMSDGPLKSLIVDGAIAGVGGVLIFLPQILILFLFIGFLEDCGYMARAAFLMDRVMGKAGLSGKSFIPMLSGFACAIPAVMATRTIENRRDRLATILVVPLMSCSARLPVYTVMIGAFVPSVTIAGWLDLRGVVLLSMYLLGVVLAVPVVWILKHTLLKGQTPPLLMELPSFKWPNARVVLMRMWQQGKAFVQRAGTVIFMTAVVIWAGAYFPHHDSITAQFAAQRQVIEAQATPDAEALAAIDAAEATAHIENSYLAKLGQAIQPVFAPLGWDWKISTAVVASFPAREVVVSTLSTLYSLGSTDDEASLTQSMQGAKRPDGQPVFNLAIALSIMVFFALCMQCISTLVVMWRETGSWQWPLFAFSYMTGLAYVCALLTYHLFA